MERGGPAADPIERQDPDAPGGRPGRTDGPAGGGDPRAGSDAGGVGGGGEGGGGGGAEPDPEENDDENSGAVGSDPGDDGRDDSPSAEERGEEEEKEGGSGEGEEDDGEDDDLVGSDEEAGQGAGARGRPGAEVCGPEDASAPTAADAGGAAASEDKFEELEKGFQKTVFDMAMDSSVAKYREEFDKLHHTLLRFRDNEKRLILKCRELNGQVAASADKVQAVLKLSQNDRSTIATLKKEVKKAWKMVEASNEKEARAKDVIAQLKQELTVAGTLSEPQYYMSPAQEKQMASLQAAEEQLTAERDELAARLESVLSENNALHDQYSAADAERLGMEQEVNTLKDLIATKKSEADREGRIKEKVEKELREVKAQVEFKSAEIKGQQATIQKNREEMTKLEATVKEQKQALDKAVKDQEKLATRAQKLQMDYEDQILSTTQLLSENQGQALELKIRDDELLKIREELRNINRVRDALGKKVKSIEEAKEQAESERESLKTMNHSFEREVMQAEQQIEANRKQIEDLIRERDILNKNFIKSTAATGKQANLVKLHEQTKRNLELEIQNYKDEASKQRKLIYALEKDRDRHIEESAQHQAEAQANLESVKIKDLQLLDYKKKIAEAEAKLKNQEQHYEAARAERNIYNKQLVECRDEITEMKRKIKIMNHQIDQLKEEITAKEGALVYEHFQHLKVEKEKDGLKADLTRLKQQNDMAQQYIQSQQAEEHKLRHIIMEADAERLRQKKEFDAVIQERDILGTQLIRRNDELALVYEKIKIQQSTLNKGEVQYRERLEDIRVLKLEIKKLRREKVILQHETANVEQLRNEIYRLQRELLRERTRVKVLEEELENPINIHRWRKLEGSDPSTFEMVQKVQTLQKRLIAKTEEVVEKELMIQAREKMYQNMKAVLARCPGPEVAEQVAVYQQNLKDKTAQIKALASELNMHQAQAGEFRYEIDRLGHELVEVKKRYYEQKKKEQQARFTAPIEIGPHKKTSKRVALGAA